MSEQSTYTCDRCGRIKGEANHWFRVWREGKAGRSTDMVIGHWPAHPRPGDERHVCGQGCLAAEVQEFADGEAVQP